MKCRIPNYNKVPISNNMMKRNIQRILESHQMSQECTNAVIRIYDCMIEKNYIGGCHALSSALYVALSELGLSPELCVGECQLPGTPPFDHSWITVNGEIIDLAVYFPLTQQINTQTAFLEKIKAAKAAQIQALAKKIRPTRSN